MKRSLTFASGLWLLVAPAAHALVDANSNGISDLWERHYNAGQLFSAANPDHAPNADPDGDGWSNAQEATAGTNPFDAKSPEGMLSPAVARTPAIIEPVPPGANLGQPDTDPTSGNTLEIRRPARFSLTWPTVEGKAYGIFQSADLEAWSPASDFFMGQGNPLTYQGEAINTDNTEPDKLFYRIKVEEADSDGDNLTDYEEGLLGTDPFSTDTDKDGIADGTEYTGGGDPLVNSLASDPDGGGLPASLAAGLIGRWDLEETYIAAIQGPYYTLARYADAVGTNPIVPFHTQPKAHGMPSKAAGATTPNPVGYLCPPRSLLSNRKTYSVSMWVKLEQASITPARPLASLFSHHRRQNKPVPYQSQYRIDVNGTWIERLANGTHVIKAGTYNYINYTPGTNQQINGVVTFTGVTSAPFAAGALDDGKYHHYLLVRANAVVSLYRDGQLIGTNSSVTPAAIDTPGDPDTGISFGRFYGPPAEQGLPSTDPQAAAASFDRLRVWSRSITAAEALALYQQDLDSDGLWDITESRTRLWRDTNSDATEQDSEHAFVSSPYIWQPSSADTDGDGLTDIEEQTIGTEIHDSDTDNDRLPDGFEVKYGLNPFVGIGADGPDGDPDGDGLSNLREYNFNSKPKALPGDPPSGQPFSATDSDGDGTGDLLEANGGSHPGDASDSGEAIPAAERITLKIGIGDNSGSHSEDYSAICHRINPETGEEEEYYTVHSGGFGQFKEETLPIFQKGQTYTFQIRWNGSDNSTRSASPGVTAEGPDFDYTFKVEPQGTDTGFLIDGYDPEYGVADLSKPLLAQDANDVAETQQEFQQDYQKRRVVLMGVSTISADRMFGASMQVLPGLEDIQLEITNTVTNEDFGTHSQLFASAYSSYEDILGAGDDFGKNVSDPRVWFIKNEQSAIRRIQVYLCSDPAKATGEISIGAAFRGFAIGSIKHTLTASPGFAQLNLITETVAAGTGLGFPGATGRTSPHATPAAGKAHHWSAALNIPVLVMNQADENSTLLAIGIYNGFIAGLADDAEFVELIASGSIQAENWLEARAIGYMTAWAADPALRLRQMKDAINGFFKQYICPAASSISLSLSSPDEWITTFWQANVKAEAALTTMKILAVHGFWTLVVDGTADWWADFSRRMLADTEAFAINSVPFPRATLLDKTVAFQQGFSYTLGYSTGYVTEQVAAGYLTLGGIQIGKILVLGGEKITSRLAIRTTAVVAARASILKKYLTGAAMSVEMRIALEEGFTLAARTPTPGAGGKSIITVIEASYKGLPAPNSTATIKGLVDGLTSNPRIAALNLIPGGSLDILSATARLQYRLDAGATEKAARNWLKFANAIAVNGESGIAGDILRFADFESAMKLNTTGGKVVATDLLESIDGKTALELITNGVPMPGSIKQIYPKMYHYADEETMVDFALDNVGGVAGKWKLLENQGGRYVTPELIDTHALVKSKSQLPLKEVSPGVFEEVPTKGRFRFEAVTSDVAGDYVIPRANVHSGAANAGQRDWLELIVKDNPARGSGGVPQFLEKREIDGAFFDTVTQQFVTDKAHLQQLINANP